MKGLGSWHRDRWMRCWRPPDSTPRWARRETAERRRRWPVRHWQYDRPDRRFLRRPNHHRGNRRLLENGQIGGNSGCSRVCRPGVISATCSSIAGDTLCPRQLQASAPWNRCRDAPDEAGGPPHPQVCQMQVQLPQGISLAQNPVADLGRLQNSGIQQANRRTMYQNRDHSRRWPMAAVRWFREERNCTE